MTEIKLYIDEEKIEKETGRKFDCEGEHSDNFLRWIKYLAWSGLDMGETENEKAFRKPKAEELYKILENCYSEYDMKHL